MAIYVISICYSLFMSYNVYKISRKLGTRKIKYESYGKFTTRSLKGLMPYFLILLICLMPMVVMAIRYNVGTDYSGTYTIDFYLIKRGIWTRNEPLSSLLYKVTSLFCEDPSLFFAVTSVVCVYLTYMGIYKISVNPLASIYLYFITYSYFTSMNAVRQMVATTIAFCATGLLIEKKYIKFGITVIVAGLFHYSAFFYLILIPLLLLKFNFKKSIKWLTVFVIVTQLFSGVIQSTIGVSVYGHYLNDGHEFNVSVIFIIINLVVYILMGVNEIKSDRYRLLMNIQMVMLVICFAQNVIPLAGRVVQLLSVYRILNTPELALAIKRNKNRKIFNYSIYGLYTLYCLYGLLIAGWDDVLPYQTIFGDK